MSLLTLTSLVLGITVFFGTGFLNWNNHWAVLGAGVLLGCSTGALIAALIARRLPALVALGTSLPWAILYARSFVEVHGLPPSDPQTPSIGHIYTTLIIACLVIPLSVSLGEFVRKNGGPLWASFDSVPGTALGVRRPHLLWLVPFLLFLIGDAFCFGALSLLWLAVVRQFGMSILIILPLLVFAPAYFALMLLLKSATHAYEAACGPLGQGENPAPKIGLRAILGSLAVSIALQVVIFALTKWTLARIAG